MDATFDLNELSKRIREIKTSAEGLNRMGGNFPALARNTDRILAAVKMLELNISDLVGLQ